MGFEGVVVVEEIFVFFQAMQAGGAAGDDGSEIFQIFDIEFGFFDQVFPKAVDFIGEAAAFLLRHHNFDAQLVEDFEDGVADR